MPMSIENILQEVLADTPVTQISCEQIDLEELLVYIEAELDGRDAVRLYPQVRAALDSSLPCRQEYDEIKAFLRLEQSGELQRPPRAPHLDFSYLSMPAPEPVQPRLTNVQPLWYWEKLGRLVVEFSEGLRQFLQSPRPQLAYTFERSSQIGKGGYQFVLENILEDLNIRINVQPESQLNDRYQIIVETEIPSRGGWPHWANTTVNLKQAETVVQTRLTDAFGKVVFDAIEATNLPQLKVEIMPGLPEESDRQSE